MHTSIAFSAEDSKGERPCIVNGKGKGITGVDLIATAATAGVDASFVKTCIERTLEGTQKHEIEIVFVKFCTLKSHGICIF